MASFEGFLDVAADILTGSTRRLRENASLESLSATEVRLQALNRNVSRMTATYPECQSIQQGIQDYLAVIADMKSDHNSASDRPPRLYGRGRPSYIIPRQQLEILVDLNFSNREIGHLLHVSASVIKRRLRQFEISRRNKFTVISDEDLDTRVRQLTQGNVSIGQRVVMGLLKNEGITMQRWRVAESLIRVDEAAVAMRWAHVIRRRTYQVAGPNALWHIDGNHKLIRWGMVIHGGIDGYSRLIVFMKVADNNRARTVYEAFMPATECYGVPSRVRCDHGVENLDVAAFMIMYRGENRGSCITGKSVHNQRIEILWRDLFQGCTSTYHALFCHLESESLLDPDNPLHLWCLHYVFMPRLRRDLEKFREGWNQHRLRSVRGKSPIQLYVSGILENRNRGQRGVDDLFYEPSTGDDVDTENYGVDWDEPVPEDENGDSLISSLDCPITDVQLSDLQRQVSPLGESADQFGIDLYLQAVEFCTDVQP